MMMNFIWEGRESPDAFVSAEYFKPEPCVTPAIALHLGKEYELMGPGVTLFLTPEQACQLFKGLKAAMQAFVDDHAEREPPP